MKARLRGWLGALVWTACLAGGLAGLDRWIGGPRVPPGWRSVVRLADLPTPPGRPWLPSYLPPALAWPARQIWVRDDATPGVWLGFDDPEGPALWLGTGRAPPPPALGAVAGCVRDDAPCPAGWRRVVAKGAGDAPVELITRLPKRELDRMARSLSPGPS